MKNAPTLHALEYGAFLALKGALRALPHRAARPLGRAVGGLGWAVDARHRRVAERNLAIAFPAMAADERRRTARECFRHFGAVLCDTVSAARFDAVGLCARWSIEGWENLQAAEDEGRGVLIMSAHLGHWEIAAQPVGLYRGDFHVVGRPADNPWLSRELERTRERFGNRALDKRGAARAMLRVLQGRGRLGILIDQRVRLQEGIRVPFFGRDAVTTPVLAKLSLRTGAPVVPIFGFMEPAGRWRVVFRPPIEPAREGLDDDDAVLALTRRYLAAVEDEVRARPAQWLWLHDRWRER
jgi:KDO2-lipid IV(A) lauroyltransferase